MGMHGEGRKRKALSFNEVAVKLEELLIFSTLLFLFLRLKRILYLRMIGIFFPANFVPLVLETPTPCTCLRTFMFVQMWIRSLISRFMK